MNDEDDGYRVGFGKPPKATRFSAENQPKNRGRKKGALGLKTELRALVATSVPVRGPDGKLRKRRPIPLLLEALMKMGVKTSVRANVEFLKLVVLLLGDDGENTGKTRLSPEDEAIIAHYLRRRDEDDAADDGPAEGDVPGTPDDEDPDSAGGSDAA